MQVRFIVIPLGLAGCQSGALLDCAEGYERAANDIECVCVDCPEPLIDSGTRPTAPTGTGTTGTYTGTGTTGTGTTGTGTTGTGTTGTGTPGGTGTPAPVMFNLQLQGTGFLTAPEIVISVIDDVTGSAVAGGTAVPTVGGAISKGFPGAVESGGTYTVDLFGDLDADGACGALEESWRVTVGPVVGDTVQAVNAVTDGEPAACATFP